MKVTKIIVVALLVSIPLGVSSRVMITEIMYDLEGSDSKREWVEVYNNTDESIDLSVWRFVENDKNHKLKLVQGDASLASQAYAVIADNTVSFLIDYPQFTGTLFDSSFSLKNSGETIGLRDDTDSMVDTVTYTSDWGAKGDGNSLSYADGEWNVGIPSPAEANVGASNNAPVDDVSKETIATTTEAHSEALSVHAHQRSLQNDVYKSALVVSLGRERLVAVGTPVYFEIDVITPKEVQPTNVSWSFGDGLNTIGSSATHVYQYNGEYVVFANVNYNGERAVARTEVQVFVPKIHITQVTNAFVELFNETQNEVNIGGWTMRTIGGKTVVPSDTILKAGSVVRLPAKAFRYPPQIHDNVILENPLGMVITSFESEDL